MKIASGIYRGCEIEFGLIAGTSGQCYVNIRICGPKLQKVYKDINEELIRKTFGFPDHDGSNFNLEIDKENNTLAWSFFYETIGKCSQFEYLASIFSSVDKMCVYISQNEDPPNDVPAEPVGN